MIKIFGNLIRSIITEVCIIFIYIFLINNFIGKVPTNINADGVGYYDYLPSLFIHHDLVRKDKPLVTDSALYHRLNTMGFYVKYKGFLVNKYPCGTAVLELPFFIYSWLSSGHSSKINDGYGVPFQKTIFHAALFYLFLALFFLKRILKLYDIKKSVIIISQLLLVFSTSVTHYAYDDAGFSHVYSLFAITAFIYFTKLFFIKRNANHFVIACVFMGLVLILRQINILIILFVPFLAGSVQSLRDGFVNLWSNPKKLLTGISLLIVVFSIQCLAWYLQTGKVLLYSYQKEGFNFKDPQILNILFSYQKGLFVYTPILFITLFGLIWLTYKRQYYLVLTSLPFLIILTYVLSSWHSWEYGCSFGMRAYIDFYITFFILFALMMNGAAPGLKLIVLILSLCTTCVNLIQTYQYKTYILHWYSMDKDKYWKVFLKTKTRYQGLLWKKDFHEDNYHVIKEADIGDVKLSKQDNRLIYYLYSSDIPDLNRVSIIQVYIDNEFFEKDDTRIMLNIFQSGGKTKYYSYNPFLIHFADNNFSEWQTGLYNYEIPMISDLKEKIITLKVFEGYQNNLLKNVRIKFLVHK